VPITSAIQFAAVTRFVTNVEWRNIVETIQLQGKRHGALLRLYYAQYSILVSFRMQSTKSWIIMALKKYGVAKLDGIIALNSVCYSKD
jgi:hypothetical protein